MSLILLNTILISILKAKKIDLVNELLNLSKDELNISKNNKDITGLFYIFVVINTTDLHKDIEFKKMKAKISNYQDKKFNTIMKNICLKLFKRIATKAGFLKGGNVYSQKDFEKDIRNCLETSFWSFFGDPEKNLIQEYLGYIIGLYLDKTKNSKNYYLDFYDLLIRKLEVSVNESEVKVEFLAHISFLKGQKFELNQTDSKNPERSFVLDFYKTIEENLQKNNQNMPELSKFRVFYKDFDKNENIKYELLFKPIVAPISVKIIETDPEKQSLDEIDDDVSDGSKGGISIFKSWKLLGLILIIIVIAIGVGFYMFRKKKLNE